MCPSPPSPHKKLVRTPPHGHCCPILHCFSCHCWAWVSVGLSLGSALQGPELCVQNPSTALSSPLPPQHCEHLPELEGNVGAQQAAHTQCQLAPASLYPSGGPVPHGLGIPVSQQGPATSKPSNPVWGPVLHQCNILRSGGDQLAQHPKGISLSLTQHPSGDQSPTNPISSGDQSPMGPAPQQGPVPRWRRLSFRSSEVSLPPACGHPIYPALSCTPCVPSHAGPPPHHSTSDIASTGHALEKTWQGDREGK